ncbi:PIN domain-containing protein [Methanoregula formicica]|uniref:Putative nucleotide-binding protein n=1 Tax=Methanoregula formicica (strain DSM 22288 / NBRC 105244 / SMSP) TaxID=593750 RepID=L0HGB9_METFS|nr:PIN domain-containing protein [Methanoregula formicica]AGB02831.1 putative nucleotide-binding protein [Methanoregula formicica SMSP]
MERDKERIRIVIDTNVLIGALIKDNSFKARIVKDRHFDFFFPDYGHIEIEKFRDYISTKRGKVPAAPSFDYAITFLLDSVTTVPRQLYKDQVQRAYKEMAAIDPKDTPFLALALHLESPIWSDDTHLKRQTLVPCYTTGEISRLSER